MRHLTFADGSINYEAFLDDAGNGTLMYNYQIPNRHDVSRYIAKTWHRSLTFMIKTDPEETCLYVCAKGTVKKIPEVKNGINV